MKRFSVSHLLRQMVILVMPAAMLLSACTPAAPAATTAAAAAESASANAVAAPQENSNTTSTREHLIIGVQDLPAGMDPASYMGNVGTRVTYSIYDMLIRRDFLNNNELVPSLATAWERTSDTVMRLTLREGVTFHNGDPFTAADVKYTFDRLRDPENELFVEAAGYFVGFKEVRVIDDYAVEIETSQPDPLLEQRLASWGSWIIPKAYSESLGSYEEFDLAPVGTGPLRVVSFSVGDVLELEAYAGYWGELPPVQKVTFRVIPEPSTRVTALINGEVQIITNIAPDQLPTLEGADNVQIKQIPLANMHVLRYNTNHPALADKRLRQAMNLAIDRQLLIDTLWGGKALPLRGHQFEEYGDLYSAERPFVPFDPELAAQLVEESDYNGEVVQFATEANYYTNGMQAAQAIVEMWRAVGINAEIRLRQPGESIPVEETMVVNWSNSSVLADPDGALWRGWGADSPTQKNSWPAPAEFNELGLEARSTLDKEVRFNNYQRMLDIWEEEAPGTVLYIPVENYAMANDVNWQPYPFYYMDLRAYNLSFE